MKKNIFMLTALFFCTAAAADSDVIINLVDAKGTEQNVGNIKIQASRAGLLHGMSGVNPGA